MATEAGELIVKISADVSDMKKGLSDIAGQTQSFGAQTIATGIIAAEAFKKIAEAAYEFVKESVLAYAEHEQALTRLTILVGKDAANAMNEYAQSLQRTTTFSDDQILSLEKQLSQYGIYPGSVKEATSALLNFAAVTGTDLPAAGSMLARAMSGQSRELKQYGLDLSTTASRSDNLSTTIKFLEGRFHDAATTMKGTTLGAVESLSNRFEDLKKRIGEDFMPVANKLIGWASESLSWFETLANANRKYTDTIADQKAKLAELVAQAKAQVSNGVTLSKQQQDEIKHIVEHISELEKLKKKKTEITGANDREISSIRALQSEVQKLQQDQEHLGEIESLTIQKNLLSADLELQQMMANERVLTETTQLETLKRMEQSRLAWEANASYSDQLKVTMQDDMSKSTGAWVNMTSTMINSFADSTAKMIVEGGRFSDVLKNLWIQIAEAVIAQIIRMIAEWLVFQAITGGTGGFGAGFLGGGASGGMINEPSMILGLRSGSTILAGEAGPEQFGPPAMNSLNSGSGGSSGVGSGSGSGDINITIQGQFLEASPTKWSSFIRDQIIPEIRRQTMSMSTGPFNRVRGAI